MRKAFICPLKYVQGEDELLNLGYFVKSYGTKAFLIAHKDDVARVKDKLDATAKKFGINFVESGFCGECSRNEITRLSAIDHGCDCIVALGGGKAIDTAKVLAEGKNLIIVPTIASTDAPTSHSAVIYTDDGIFEDYAYFFQSPSVVLIDTTIIANAPVRFLVSGMGDALATYFEARASAASYSRVNAGLPCGGGTDGIAPALGTNTANMMAKLCYETLLADGVSAKKACENKVVTKSLENIIEANILLSGLGFESAGLAAAHAVHNGLSALDATHDYYHGEKVAFGVLVQLVLENAPTEKIEEVLGFCTSVGLPVCLADIGVSSISDAELLRVAEKSCISEESIHFMPFAVSAQDVVAAIKVADATGKEYKEVLCQ